MKNTTKKTVSIQFKVPDYVKFVSTPFGSIPVESLSEEAIIELYKDVCYNCLEYRRSKIQVDSVLEHNTTSVPKKSS